MKQKEIIEQLETDLNSKEIQYKFEINCKYGFYTCANFDDDFCSTCDEGDNYEENYLNYE
jgi:hypothetical protein